MESGIDIIWRYVRKYEWDMLTWNIEEGLEKALQNLFTEDVADYLLKIFKGDKKVGFTLETLELELLRKRISDLENNKIENNSIIQENNELKKQLEISKNELNKIKSELMKGDIINGERFTLLEID